MSIKPKFKVGDFVKPIGQVGTLEIGQSYRVEKVWYNSAHGCTYIRLDFPEAPINSYFEDWFELVDPNPVLTPEEVFEHLRKGTKLEYEHEYKHNGYTINEWKACANPQFANILNRKWRIKPEPEVIELNGKKYREIID